MSVESALYTWITGSTAVTDAVSDKITPLGAHEVHALPYVVYERLSTDNPPHLQGGTTRANTRLVYDCYADSYAKCQQTATALYDRLHGRSGSLGSTAFDSVLVENQFDDAIPPADGSDEWTYVTSLTVAAWHAVTVPSS